MLLKNFKWVYLQTSKMWVDKGTKFYHRSMKSWLEKNATEMYSIHNEKKYVVAERFMRNLKNKIYKYMTLMSKNVCIDKLNEIVNKYNNTYHRNIKMKPDDVKPNMKIVKKVLNLNLVIMLEHSNTKGDVPNWWEELFVIKKVKNTIPWTYVIKGEEIVRTFYEKALQKTNQKDIRVEKY